MFEGRSCHRIYKSVAALFRSCEKYAKNTKICLLDCVKYLALLKEKPYNIS